MADTSIGEITPNIYVSSITLEGVGSFYSASDPHVDHDSEPDVEVDPITGKRKLIKRTGSFDDARLGLGHIKITLDLVLKEILQNGLIGSWLSEENLLKYLKLKVYQFSNKNIFDSIRNDVNNLALIDAKVQTLLRTPAFSKKFFEEKTIIEEQRIIENNVEVRDVRVSEHIQGERSNVLKRFNVVNENGDRVFDIPLQMMFQLRNTFPKFLSYLLFTYLDIEEIAQDLGFRDALPNLFTPVGRVIVEEVIENSVLKTNTFGFFDENNNIWTGPIEEVNSELFGKTNRGNVKLQRIEVYNSKLRDFRITKNLEELKLNFSFTENVFNKIKFKKTSLLSSQVSFDNSYVSDILLSRDDEGNCRFGFFVDVRKVLQNFSILGGLFTNISNFQVFSESSIFSLKVFRRRVLGSPEVGSKPNTKFSFEKNQKDELVAYSGEKAYKTFSKRSTDVGAIKEITNISFIQDGSIRFFTGIDKEMKDVTDGYYVYDIYLEMLDPSYKFVQNKIKELNQARTELHRYYYYAISVGSKGKEVSHSDPHINFEGERDEVSKIKTGNFDPFLNRFTNSFIKEMFELYGDGNVSPWRKSIITYLNNLSLFSNILKNDRDDFENVLITLSHPATGNPAGIKKVLELLETLLLTLNNLIKDNITQSSLYSTNDPTSKVSIKNFDNKVIKIVKKNKNVFNSNIVVNTGLDYLDVQDRFFDGFKTINGIEYIERVERETNKYFNDNKNLDISLKVGNNVYTENDLLERSGLTYLSPAKLKFAVHFELKRIGSSPTPKLSNDELIKATILSKVSQTNQLTSYVPNVETTSKEDFDVQNSIKNANLIFQNLGVSINNKKQNTNTGLIDNKVNEARSPSQEDKLILEAKKCINNFVNVPKTSLPLLGELLEQTEFQPSSANTSNTFVVSEENVPFDISKFDIRTENNSLKTLLKDTTNISSELFFQGELHNTTINQAISSLPNQVKALFLSNVNKPAVKNSPFEAINIKQIDKTAFSLDYEMLNTILVLIGFQQDEQGFPLPNSPVWAPLTPARFNLGIGKSLLCKMRPYENSLIGIEKSRIFDLPIFDEYFVITPTSPIIVKINPIDLGTRANVDTNLTPQAERRLETSTSQDGTLERNQNSQQGRVPDVDIGQSSLSGTIKTTNTSREGKQVVSINTQYLQTSNINIK